MRGSPSPRSLLPSPFCNFPPAGRMCDPPFFDFFEQQSRGCFALLSPDVRDPTNLLWFLPLCGYDNIDPSSPTKLHLSLLPFVVLSSLLWHPFHFSFFFRTQAVLYHFWIFEEYAPRAILARGARPSLPRLWWGPIRLFYTSFRQKGRALSPDLVPLPHFLPSFA